MVAVHLLDPAAADAASRRAATWLTSQGLATGDRVAVAGLNHPGTLAVTNGALRAGIVPVVLREDLGGPERAWVLGDAEPALTVERPDHEPWRDEPPADLPAVPRGRPMFYTSGTTGRQKGVWSGVLPEEPALAWAEDERELWGPEPGAAFLVCSPLHHSAGYRAATSALLAGSSVVLLDRFVPGTVLRVLTEEPVTGAFLVPTHLRRIFAAAGEPPYPRAIRKVLHAGEPCPSDLKRRAMEWLPPGTLWEFYGSTEGQFTAISPQEWLERPRSVGRARPGRRLRVADPDPDGVGTVFVSAPPFARWEYWRDPARTAEAWRGEAFTAGDLGRVDRDGYLFLVSRREDLIISGGVNVYPAEVERVLLEHPAVTEAVVFGRPDPEWESGCARRWSLRRPPRAT
jgi:long-chain acyl-CoA synthetase